MLKFLFSLFLGLPFINGEYCNYNGGVHEIRNEIELNQLQNCTSINGSLFINGEYNIKNLNKLSNLKSISGYLLIWNTHNLTDLMGLNNLKSINGTNLYLDSYFLYIIDNHNLCFVNTIDWSLLNSNNLYRTALNGNNCESCNSLCNGCWNSELCQNCKYFKSGTICVEQCPVGTDIEGSTCIEFIPFPPEDILIESLNFTIKNITWNPPQFPNGVILGYNFYLDDELLYSGMKTDYLLDNLNLNTNYNIKVNVFNSEGNSDNVTTILDIGDGLPQIPYNITDEIVNQTLIIRWLSDGHQFFYQLLNKTGNYSYNKELIFDDLDYYSNYSIKIKAYSIYGESNYSNWHDFVSYEFFPKTPNPPDLLLNNLSLNIKFNPDYPVNGKILKYNFRVFQNNNLYLNQSTINDNVNISTNYYKDYEIDYNLTNSLGTSQISNISHISTPVGKPLIPQLPILHYNRNFDIEIKEESDINGPIIKYEILMYNLSNMTVIYSNNTPGNVTLNNLDKETIYEFQSKVYTSDIIFSKSEKISYSPILDQNHDEVSWWIIFLIVLGSLILLCLIILFVWYYFDNILNKVGDSVVVNESNKPNTSFERINPAYHTLNTVRRTQNPIYYNGLNRRKSDSNYYSEVDRPAISNSVYESLHTPSNPPDIPVPKNMLKE